jgi:ZIP family zinc transporter
MNTHVGLALLLPTLAGLCTVLGGLLVILVRKPGPRFMVLMLGFSAGVMLLISFAELLQEAVEQVGFAKAYVAFFGGMIGMFLIDALVPHDFMAEEHHASKDPRQAKMLRTALFLALGIGIHNFPEGMASFAGALHDPTLGLAIAVAIALHNIPEGLAVALPIQAATGKPGKALWWTFLSGMAEPVGALLAAAILLPLLNAALLGTALAVVGGIMVFIALDELIPVACSYGQEHLTILGVTGGMAVMVLSLWLLHAR